MAMFEKLTRDRRLNQLKELLSKAKELTEQIRNDADEYTQAKLDPMRYQLRDMQQLIEDLKDVT